MGQYFDPAVGLCYYGTSARCTDHPSSPTKATEGFSQAVNSFLYPEAVATADNNDVGFSRYSIELSSKQVLQGKRLEVLPAALQFGYSFVRCFR
jgi:hypothetical protein